MNKKDIATGKSKRYCIAYWCLNANVKNWDLTYFSLPSDEERRKQWLILLGREDLLNRENFKPKSYSVCSSHFDQSQMKLVKYLNLSAVPVKNIGPNSKNTSDIEPPSKRMRPDEPTASTSHDLHGEPGTSVPILNDPIHIYPEEAEDDIAIRFHKLIDWQNELKKRGKDEYETEYKNFAYNLLIHSPHAYQCLKTILKLPTKQSLYNYKLNIPPNLDFKVLHRLEIKLKSLPDSAKHCVIYIDRIPLKKHIYYDTQIDEVTGFHNINGTKKTEMAKYAIVLMLQGVHFKWQQPVAYALHGDGEYYQELDKCLQNVVSKLSGIGIKIKAITFDDSSYFVKFVNDYKNITVARPYAVYDGETRVYFIFNIPNLMKSLRNYLLASELCYGEKNISWYFIKTLLNEDGKSMLVPKLTKSHIEPNEEERKKIQYAVEIFSRSVSTALMAFIEFGQLSEEARPTALFIETINNLFDVLNSSKLESENEFQSAFRMTEAQKNILEAATELFETIKKSTGQIDTIEQFQLSIESIKMLYEDQTKEGFSYILTKQLNRDCIDNFVETLQQHKLHSCTPIFLRRRFSKLFSRYLMKTYSSVHTIRGLDFCDVLSKAELMINFTLEKTLESQPMSEIALSFEKDYQMDLPEHNTLIYISSYLLYKCSRKHKCDVFDRFLDTCRKLNDSSLFSRDLNKKSGFYGNLKIPRREFIDYIQSLEAIITQNLYRIIKKNPGSHLFKLLGTVQHKMPCTCFPVSYLLKLFVRLRIYATLKFNNSCGDTEKFLKIKHF